MNINALTLVAASNSGNGTPLGAASAAPFQTGGAGTAFSVGCFVKLASRPSTIMGMLTKWDSTSAATSEWMLVNGGPQVNLVVDGPSGAQYNIGGTTTLAIGTWYFVVGTFSDISHLMHLYIDAVSNATPVACSGAQATSTAFRVGGAVADPTWAFDGEIAEAFKFPFELTPTQITWLYNSGSGRTAAEILAHAGLTTPDFLYGFDNSGALGTDSGPNGLTLTSVGSTPPTQGLGPPTTQAALTGPTTGTAGSPSTNFTVTLNEGGPAGSAQVITLADDSGGNTFAGTGVSGTTLTIPAGTASATFTYTRATAGTSNISISGSGLAISGSPIGYVASSAAPTSVTVTGPSTLTLGGGPGVYTFTLDHPAPSGGVSIVPSATGFTAGFSTNPIVIAAGATFGTTAVTPTSAGTGTVTGTSSGLAFTPQGVTVSSSGGGPLTPGTATAGSTTSSTAAATATEANGGTTPYTHQWYRSTASGTLGSPVSGQTTTTLADSGLSPSTSYYYTLRYTDAVPNHVDSNQVTETTSAAPTTTTYQTGVEGFATGLVGGTTSGFGYKVGLDGMAFGSLVTAGIVADSPGSYSAQFTVPVGSIPRVEWLDGSGLPGGSATDYNPTTLPGSGGGGGPFPSRMPPNWTHRDGFADDTMIDGVCPAASSSTRIYFDPADVIANALPLGALNPPQIVAIRKGTGVGQLLSIAAIGATSGARHGDVMAGATIAPTLDTTSGYAWPGALAGLALASQIPAHFTDATFSADGVFAAPALAAAPTGGGTGTAVTLQNGLVLASPVPTATSFTASGLTMPTRGGASMRLLFQGGLLDGVARRVATCTAAGGGADAITLEFDANNLLPAPPVGDAPGVPGQRFLLG